MEKSNLNIKDFVEYRNSNPMLENKNAHINNIKERSDGLRNIQLIIKHSKPKKTDVDYLFNNPLDCVKWWVHENDIIKVL